MERIVNFIRKQSHASLFIQALALAASIVFIDYVTGYEVTVLPFYAIPILFIVWFGNIQLAVYFSPERLGVLVGRRSLRPSLFT